MRLTRIIIGCSALALAVAAGTPAAAQDPNADRPNAGRRQAAPQLAPETAEAARTWLAKDVARAMSLDAETTQKLVKAYLANRKQRDEAERAARGQGRQGRGPGRGQGPGQGQGQGQGQAERGAGGNAPAGDAQAPGRGRGEGRGNRNRGRGFGRLDPEAIAKARKELESSFTAFLAPEQAAKATEMLFPLTRQSDRMVAVIAGFELDEPKTYEAVRAIRTYAGAIRKGMREARESGDRQAMRDVFLDARDDLQDAMDAILSASQMEKFEEATMRRRGRGRRQDPIF
jgi:hypothetical protein